MKNISSRPDAKPVYRSTEFKNRIISEYTWSGGQMNFDENDQSPRYNYEKQLSEAKTIYQVEEVIRERLSRKMKAVFY